MRNKKLIASLLAASLLLTGCKKNIKPSDTNKVVAKTKESKITIDELYDEMKLRFSLPLLLNKLDQNLLDATLKMTEEEKEEERKSLDLKMKEQKQYFESVKQSNPNMTWLSFLQSQGLKNEEDLRNHFSLEFKKDLNSMRYAKTIVTDKEIKAYYKNEAIGDMRAKHILIAPKKDPSAKGEDQEKAKKEALKQAEEIIEKLKKGEKFDDLAKKYSNDKKKDGGDLGWFKQNTMEKPFEEACFKLKLNKFTEKPVETVHGYHIILKTGEKEKEKLDKMKDKIIDILSIRKLQTVPNIQAKAMIALREKNGFKIDDKELEKQYKTYLTNNK